MRPERVQVSVLVEDRAVVDVDVVVVVVVDVRFRGPGRVGFREPSDRFVVCGGWGNLEGRVLRFGPLPVEALAGCSPIVRVAPVPVVGMDGGGNTIWDTKSVFPVEAQTDQGQAFRVRVGPP